MENLKSYKAYNWAIIIFGVLGMLVSIFLFNEPANNGSQKEMTIMLVLLVFLLSTLTGIFNIQKKYTTASPKTKSGLMVFLNFILMILFMGAVILFFMQGGNMKLLKLILLPILMAFSFYKSLSHHLLISKGKQQESVTDN